MTLETTRRGLEDLLLPAGAEALPIHLIASESDPALQDLSETERSWVEAQGWSAKQGSVLLLPEGRGGIGGVLLGTGGKEWTTQVPLLTGVLPGALPEGDYRFASPLPDPELAALGFLAGLYRFTRYKTANEPKPKRLVLPHGASKDQVLALAEALYFGRDLINTPANDLGPAELEGAARELATSFGGSIKVTEGSGLLSDNFPMIHAVGRASDRAPRLIDLRWGSEQAPKVTIVGKGICFDSGGLDIKPSSGMALMKKDMGGAASALSFALLVMRAKLPVRLRVLIPAAENSIAGNAFRPGDVLPSRNGMTVEIGNTDAEGRLVLADGLSLAAEGKPDRIVDVATLTGACMIALGSRTTGILGNDDDFRDLVFDASTTAGESMWPLPIVEEMKEKVTSSSVADLRQHNPKPQGGALYAAAFLREFVGDTPWAHLDIAGPSFNEDSARDYTPVGGTGVGVRTLIQIATALSESR
jgi:leucyl aminopeptidase